MNFPRPRAAKSRSSVRQQVAAGARQHVAAGARQHAAGTPGLPLSQIDENKILSMRITGLLHGLNFHTGSISRFRCFDADD